VRAQHIATVAAGLFAERGYAATSVDDIGAAVGVSGPALYWHFANKQAMLAAILTDISERLLAGGLACVDDASSGEAALEALVAQQVEFAVREPDLIIVHARELHHLEAADAHRVRSLQRQYVDVWVGVLEPSLPGVARTRIAAGVQAAIGLVNSTPYLGRVDRAALKPMLSRMALAAISSIDAPHT
jgi:AcrR family transcriptional regulator